MSGIVYLKTGEAYNDFFICSGPNFSGWVLVPEAITINGEEYI